jgi:hypothetical protein
MLPDGSSVFIELVFLFSSQKTEKFLVANKMWNCGTWGEEGIAMRADEEG